MREDSLHFRRRRFDSYEVEAAIPIYRSGIIPPSSAVCEWRGRNSLRRRRYVCQSLPQILLLPFPKTALRKKVTLSVVPISKIIIAKFLHLRRGGNQAWVLALLYYFGGFLLLLESLFGRSRLREWLSSAFSGVM